MCGAHSDGHHHDTVRRRPFPSLLTYGSIEIGHVYEQHNDVGHFPVLTHPTHPIFFSMYLRVNTNASWRTTLPPTQRRSSNSAGSTIRTGRSSKTRKLAFQYLTKSLEAGALPTSLSKKSYSLCHCGPFGCPEMVSLLWRAYMAGQIYNKVYEAYQQPVSQRPKPHLLELHRCPLLPDQSIP